jgi:GNAT superfamily N-acetyltransferase
MSPGEQPDFTAANIVPDPGDIGVSSRRDRRAGGVDSRAPRVGEVCRDPLITVSDVAEPEAEQVIRDGLHGFNDAVVGYNDRRQLNVVVRDRETGAILGGVHGRTSLGVLFVDLVFLPEDRRGQDIGTRMMRVAEDEARRRGCKSGVLCTISFQAPQFYRRLGWRVLGEIVCDPPGTTGCFWRSHFDGTGVGRSSDFPARKAAGKASIQLLRAWFRRPVG